MRTLFILLFCSQFTLSQNESKDTLNDSEISPLFIPDPDYQKKNTTNSEQSGNQRTPQNNKNDRGQKIIKPAEWLLESSLNSAPKLLKGIFAYLKDRSKKSSDVMIVPSFHRFILVGPPGSGKTTLAYAIAHKLGYTIVLIPAMSLLGRYRNETAINIQRFLKEHADMNRNMIIIIDELHKLFEHYAHEYADDSQTAASFWLMLDHLEKYNPNVIVIGTANCVKKLPPEIKSRFAGKIISLPLPNLEQKIMAFKNNLKHDHCILLDPSIDDSFIESILRKKNNCSLRDVQLIIDTAKMFSYAENSPSENRTPVLLTREHLQQALKQLASESVLLEENISEVFYNRLNTCNTFFSVAVNATSLIKMILPYVKDILHIITIKAFAQKRKYHAVS